MSEELLVRHCSPTLVRAMRKIDDHACMGRYLTVLCASGTRLAPVLSASGARLEPTGTKWRPETK